MVDLSRLSGSLELKEKRLNSCTVLVLNVSEKRVLSLHFSVGYLPFHVKTSKWSNLIQFSRACMRASQRTVCFQEFSAKDSLNYKHSTTYML